jgi:CarD family transcriptional regulator
MAFRVGERVVYPNHGVGIIENVATRNVTNQFEEFYYLRIQSTNSLVMVPTSNADNVGLRKIINKSDVPQLFKLLEKDFDEPEPDWKGRFKENSEKMRTGSVFQVAEVLKNLVYLSYQKTLSFREKRMLDRAKQLLVCEIATVRNHSEKSVEQMVDKALSSAYRRTRGAVSV